MLVLTLWSVSGCSSIKPWLKSLGSSFLISKSHSESMPGRYLVKSSSCSKFALGISMSGSSYIAFSISSSSFYTSQMMSARGRRFIWLERTSSSSTLTSTSVILTTSFTTIWTGSALRTIFSAGLSSTPDSLCKDDWSANTSSWPYFVSISEGWS